MSGQRYYKLDNLVFLKAADAAAFGTAHKRIDFSVGRVGGVQPSDAHLNKELRERPTRPDSRPCPKCGPGWLLESGDCDSCSFKSEFDDAS